MKYGDFCAPGQIKMDKFQSASCTKESNRDPDLPESRTKEQSSSWQVVV